VAAAVGLGVAAAVGLGVSETVGRGFGEGFALGFAEAFVRGFTEAFGLGCDFTPSATEMLKTKERAGITNRILKASRFNFR
jgi:hypothetical protein